MPLSENNISQRLSTSLRGMQILLNVCESMRLLMSEKKEGTVYYQMSQMARRYLTSSSKESLLPWIKFYSETVYPCAQHSVHAVREGKQQIGKQFGDKNMNYFDVMYSSREQAVLYLDVMSSAWNICGEDVVTAFDLSSFKNVYDLGGNTGALAKKFISAYPQSSVTVYDLPQMIHTARTYDKLIKDSQISFQEGDLFKDPIPTADMYIMARVIHVLSEDKCIELLRKVYTACKPGGAVVVVECFLKDATDEVITANTQHFLMALATEGKERTPKEMSLLLENAGFQDVQIKETGKIYDPMIGRKVLK
ncbi:acetylserotonin O-methyltransferase-like [Protopterus annectens]|uniref:acetylserotonin O-methyltransferase-like n=1 Tax=Protopterus annectens TaxID=7888 RepID=UPI001CFC0463|nr:acetylserotonin O-methyltransferase-like [Protopterus annectens]